MNADQKDGENPVSFEKRILNYLASENPSIYELLVIEDGHSALVIDKSEKDQTAYLALDGHVDGHINLIKLGPCYYPLGASLSQEGGARVVTINQKPYPGDFISGKIRYEIRPMRKTEPSKA
jgi:hypothetical protein